VCGCVGVWVWQVEPSDGDAEGVEDVGFVDDVASPSSCSWFDKVCDKARDKVSSS